LKRQIISKQKAWKEENKKANKKESRKAKQYKRLSIRGNKLRTGKEEHSKVWEAIEDKPEL